jgi:glyoxylase-like metal-dependent hydrolase (beta-lactamase superfamily II)
MDRFTIQVGSYEVNCSIVSEGARALVVDPGSEGERIARLLAQKGLEPAAILLTHGHFDHIGGVNDLQAAFPGLPVYVHPDDTVMFGHPFNQNPPDYPLADRPRDIRDARTLPADAPTLGFTCAMAVIPTPGHTPGGVCYHFPADKLLLSGDTLFAGSAGRTDFPGGSMNKLMASLKTLAELPDDTLVIPGHGPHTTIAAEKATNPFLV